MSVIKTRLLKDVTARHVMLGLTVLSILVLFVIGIGLWIKSKPILDTLDWSQLLFTSNWRPFKGEFGFGGFFVSTFYVTLLGILIALPLSLLTGIYLCEYAKPGVRRFFMPVIDLLSGIPPVIYGVWGTLALIPFISDTLAPRFVDFSTGYSVLAAGVVLAVMIVPLIISILTEVFRSIPPEMREASLALGATKWETIRKVVLRKAVPGIIAATVLAVSRAFGETIAVLMVCGNTTDMPQSVFDSCYPLPALIANNYGEMMSIPGYESALMLAALVLFVVIVLFNAGSRLWLNYIAHRYQ
jgi:phosphate transport system permease protein